MRFWWKNQLLRQKILWGLKQFSSDKWREFLADPRLLLWKDSNHNTIFHLAVIHQRPDLVALFATYPEWRCQKNIWELTPSALAKVLSRREIRQVLKTSPFFEILIREKEEARFCSQQDFESIFGIEYIPSLEFADFSTYKKVFHICKKAVKKGLIEPEHKWLGCYYEKELSSEQTAKVQVQWINPILEYGIFARENLPAQTFIGEYAGVVRKCNFRRDRKNAYCFEYKIGSDNDSYTIDAKEKGNFIRFINHSYSPNLVPKALFYQGLLHIVLVTNQKVAKGTELTYHYGDYYWAEREAPV